MPPRRSATISAMMASATSSGRYGADVEADGCMNVSELFFRNPGLRAVDRSLSTCVACFRSNQRSQD